MNLTGHAVRQKSVTPPADMAYMRAVKQLPCCVCGAPPPSDAHHCTHRPLDGEPHAYTLEPAAGRRSGDRDTIPLCKCHHQTGPEAIHNGKASWRMKHGPDFGFIPATRAAVAAMTGEIDF